VVRVRLADHRELHRLLTELSLQPDLSFAAVTLIAQRESDSA
jgi:hypothetical protein